MRKETDVIIIGTVLVLFFGLVSQFILSHRVPATLTEEYHGSWSCTADVYICPDGSEVGRIPPYCHFGPCQTAQ